MGGGGERYSGGKGGGANGGGAKENVLNYSRRGFTDEDLNKLPVGKTSYAYEEVDFSQNELSSEGLTRVLEICSRCQRLRILKLFKNNIDDVGASKLAEFCKHCHTMEEIHLSHNRFTAKGAEVLTIACEDSRPRGAAPLWLRLEMNRIEAPKDVLRQLSNRYSVCGRDDQTLCTSRVCKDGKKVHLPFFHLQKGHDSASHQGKRDNNHSSGHWRQHSDANWNADSYGDHQQWRGGGADHPQHRDDEHEQHEPPGAVSVLLTARADISPLRLHSDSRSRRYPGERSERQQPRRHSPRQHRSRQEGSRSPRERSMRSRSPRGGKGSRHGRGGPPLGMDHRMDQDHDHGRRGMMRRRHPPPPLERGGGHAGYASPEFDRRVSRRQMMSPAAGGGYPPPAPRDNRDREDPAARRRHRERLMADYSPPRERIRRRTHPPPGGDPRAGAYPTDRDRFADASRGAPPPPRGGDHRRQPSPRFEARSGGDRGPPRARTDMRNGGLAAASAAKAALAREPRSRRLLGASGGAAGSGSGSAHDLGGALGGAHAHAEAAELDDGVASPSVSSSASLSPFRAANEKDTRPREARVAGERSVSLSSSASAGGEEDVSQPLRMDQKDIGSSVSAKDPQAARPDAIGDREASPEGSERRWAEDRGCSPPSGCDGLCSRSGSPSPSAAGSEHDGAAKGGEKKLSTNGGFPEATSDKTAPAKSRMEILKEKLAQKWQGSARK